MKYLEKFMNGSYIRIAFMLIKYTNNEIVR
jgi:hypothetical protein